MITNMVPPLEDLREMSDADLLRLRTNIASDLAVIHHQIRYGDRKEDESWVFRAGAAAHIREHGLMSIKNILAERSPHRSVLLSSWLKTLQQVVDAAVVCVHEYDIDEDDEVGKSLEVAVGCYQEYCVNLDEQS